MSVSTADPSGTVTLDPGATPLAAWRAIYNGADVALAAQSRVAVDAGAATIERIVALGTPVYGVNTGFGKLSMVRIEAADLTKLQRNIVLSHSVGVGEPASIEALTHPRMAPAIERNWIKLHPSCLGTHSPIDAAEQLRGRVNGGALEVLVHPVARQAAHLDVVSDGLSAKFSIPYCVAHTLTHGAPRTADFVRLDGGVVERAAAVSVSLDDSLPQWGTVLKPAGVDPLRLDGPRGAPGQPITEAELAGKVSDLAGDRLDGVLDDPGMPADQVLRVAGLNDG